MHHAGRRAVVGIGAMAGEKTRVLDARDAGADELGAGGVVRAHDAGLFAVSPQSACLATCM